MDSWKILGSAVLLLVLTSGDIVVAQLSPGPLARPHRDLEGSTQCFNCHGRKRGESDMNTQCVNCHEEIGWQLERKLGLHGQEQKEDCATCHPDHAGPDFELIAWDDGGPERFDHDRTGWPLSGRHADAECAACHQAKFQTGAVMMLLKRPRSSSTWLGLQRECTSCHADGHEPTLGPDCSRCHSTARWIPAPRFDHSTAAFLLDGRHLKVDCVDCHLVPGKVFSAGDDGAPEPLYRPVPHEDCVDCHADPHRRPLGPTCAGCHASTGFDRVADSAFDHSRTRFPLRGAHARVKCEACHDRSTGHERRPAFGSCTSCHADPHAGQATRDGRQVDCASCHDERSFRDSSFTATDHESTRYPLRGKHLSVECRSCHIRNPPGISRARLGEAGVWLRPRSDRCGDCHAKAHGDQFEARADEGACESCHAVDGWVPSNFTVAEHAALALPLEGLHARIPCAACHGPHRESLPELPGTSVLGPAGVALTTLDASCNACHLDPHERVLDRACSTCHSAERFRPSLTDADLHRSFDYPLVGSHRVTACVECHVELALPPSNVHLLEARGEVRSLRFEIADTRCESCHQTPHGNQFAGREGGEACDVCHTLEAFRPANRFDHDRDASYPLTGGHREVPCESCHRVESSMVIYRPVRSNCRDCHGVRFRDGGNQP